MPRPTWADDEQTAFLTDKKKGFTDSQATGRSRAFLNSTCEAFLERWPLEPPTAMEIGEEEGDAEAAKAKKLKKWQKRIEHWLRNHTRANATGTTNARTAVLSLTPKKVQPLLPYQAYMCLFRERVMGTIRKNYDTYKAGLDKEKKPRGWWSFAIEDATRLLAQEPDDVKSQVETFRTEALKKSKVENVDIAKLEEMDSDEAAEKVHALQQAINLLPRTGQEALKAIETQTGFYGVLLVGGPNPETGRLVTLAIHNGRTISLNNLFSDASEDWPVVQNAFDNFIARCFDPNLPGRLEKAYRGETPTNQPAASSPSALPPSTTDATPHPAIPPSSATPPPREPSSRASPDPDDEPDYEAEREKVVRRNAIIAERLRAGETMAEILESIDKELPEDEEPDWLTDGVPEWIEDALEYLKGVCQEGWWAELLEEWVAFERATGFPEGQNQRNWLPSKGRPEEAKYWIARGRQYEKPPKISSLAMFVAAWKDWWTRLQPGVRRTNKNTNWPLARTLPREDGDWAKLKRGGCNGIFMVIMCLSWWVGALADEEDCDNVQLAVEDVKWACIAMTNAERLTADPSPSPASTTPAPLTPTSRAPESTPPVLAASPAPVVSPAPASPAPVVSPTPASPAPVPVSPAPGPATSPVLELSTSPTAPTSVETTASVSASPAPVSNTGAPIAPGSGLDKLGAQEGEKSEGRNDTSTQLPASSPPLASAAIASGTQHPLVPPQGDKAADPSFDNAQLGQRGPDLPTMEKEVGGTLQAGVDASSGGAGCPGTLLDSPINTAVSRQQDIEMVDGTLPQDAPPPAAAVAQVSPPKSMKKIPSTAGSPTTKRVNSDVTEQPAKRARTE